MAYNALDLARNDFQRIEQNYQAQVLLFVEEHESQPTDAELRYGHIEVSIETLKHRPHLRGRNKLIWREKMTAWRKTRTLQATKTSLCLTMLKSILIHLISPSFGDGLDTHLPDTILNCVLPFYNAHRSLLVPVLSVFDWSMTASRKNWLQRSASGCGYGYIGYLKACELLV